MPDSLIAVPADLRRDLAIEAITSTIVDVPTVRRHKLSQTSVTAQSYVIVELRLANGVTGIGEAATLGGPRWSEESVEAIKANIDAYLAPAVLGLPADSSPLPASGWTRRRSATTPPRPPSRPHCSMPSARP